MSELITGVHRPLPRTVAPAEPGFPTNDSHGPGWPDRRVVFTGEWLMDGCDCHPYTVGYSGSLVRYCNGWCVFRTSRAVAEAIVGEYQHALMRLVIGHVGQGAYLPDAWLAALEEHPSITWHGSMVVVDRRLCTDDDAAVEVTLPDTEGLYTIGWGLSWDRVDIAAVHTVHGAPNT